MIILGLNGLSRWGFHDPSACILINGKLEHFVEEERLARIKHAPGRSPALAVRECLNLCQVDWGEIDKVAFGWDLPRFARRADPSLDPKDIGRLLLRDIGAPEGFPVKRLVFVSHHEAHAWASLPLAGGMPSLVVVVDGQGETESTSVFRASGGRLELLETYDARFSLGYFYEAVAWYLGLGLAGTGKLMGLAAYGPETSELVFIESEKSLTTIVPTNILESMPGSFDDARAVVERFWIPFLRDRFPGIDSSIEATQAPFAHRDNLDSVKEAVRAAAFAQANVESAVCTLLARHLTGADRAIVLSGGVALNCRLNGLIARHFPDRAVHISPTPHDAGAALGAAIRVAIECESQPVSLGEFPYTGRAFSDAEVAEALRTTGVTGVRVEDVASVAADLISSGACIGWFQGAAEVGPRALGGRSIMASAASSATRDHLNSRIKARERWRPFGPMVLGGHEGRHFGCCSDARFMIKSFPVNLVSRSRLGAVVHVDGSTRPQVVYADGPERMCAALLKAVQAQVGDPWVLNTSFNRANEPIVYTPREAIQAFRAMPLDALVLGQWLVRRPNPEQS
ncbi:MAG: hypothetical protein H7841_09980 [Magnetospirillum sp. WYHS-4]